MPTSLMRGFVRLHGIPFSSAGSFCREKWKLMLNVVFLCYGVLCMGKSLTFGFVNVMRLSKVCL